jgi:hypothetical protein
MAPMNRSVLALRASNYIFQWHLRFGAKYSGHNSFEPASEQAVSESPLSIPGWSWISIAINLQMLMDGRVALPVIWNGQQQLFTD